MPEQWHLHRSQWRYVNALVPYFGPPTFTFKRVWAPFCAVMVLCAIIKVIEGRISWKLDHNNHSFKIYSSSSFMLSLLIAFRLVRAAESHVHVHTAMPQSCSCAVVCACA